MKRASRITTVPGAPSIRALCEWVGSKISKGSLLKPAQALLLAIAVCFSLGATDASSRYNDLGHRLMCTCGCNQLLGECNHVGCPDSPGELNELRAAIADGKTDQQTLDWFAAKYGATMLAAPTMHGFNLVAWIAPFAVLAAGFLGTFLLVRRWSAGNPHLPARHGPRFLNGSNPRPRRTRTPR